MSDIEQIELSAGRLRVIAKNLHWVFTGLFAMVIVATILVFALTIADALRNRSSEALTQIVSANMKLILEAAIALIVTWILRTIFAEISKGKPPFSFVQARRLKIAGGLFLAHAVFVAVFSPAILSIAGFDDLVVGAAVGATSASSAMHFIPINMGDIVLAIVLFCAVLIVEYGSLLQQLSDDTV